MSATNTTDKDTLPAGRKNSLLSLAACSLLGSGIAAAWGLCMVTWTLPETDLAYGQAPPFGDPFVLTVLLILAGIAGAVTFVASAFTMRHAPLIRSFLGVLLAALVTITVATPLFDFRGTAASVPVVVAALIYCRLKYPRPG